MYQSDNNIRLPIKIIPYEYESLSGYIRRLALANGYPSIKWIVDVMKMIDPSVNLRHTDYKKLLFIIAGLSNEEVYRYCKLTTDCDNSNYINKPFRSKFKICPICVASNGYHDNLWFNRYISACPKHRVLLIDRCHTCHETLDWGRVDIKFCKCGADITKYTEAVDSHILYYNTKIYIAAGRSVEKIILPGVPDYYLSKLSLSDLIGCYRIFSDMLNNNVINNDKPKSVEKALEFYERVHLIASDWPIEFNRTIDRHKVDDSNNEYIGLKKVYKKIYNRLYSRHYKLIKQDDANFIADAFEKYILENWTGFIDERYRNFISRHECKWMPSRQISRTLHISKPRISQLISLNIIDADHKTSQSGRTHTFIKRCELNKLAALSRYLVNKKESCYLLGVSKVTFDLLVDQMFIHPVVRAGEHGFSEWWCDKRDLENFLNQFSTVAPDAKPPYGCVEFSRMCQTRLTHRDYLPGLLRSILRGDVPIAGVRLMKSDNAFKLSSMCFDPEVIRTFRLQSNKADLNRLSIPEAAHALNLKEQVTYHLVNMGILPAQVDPVWPKRGRLVSSAALKDFVSTYIPLREIAQSQGCCPKTAMHILAQQCIVPVIGGGADGCRQVFYRKRDLPASYGVVAFE